MSSSTPILTQVSATASDKATPINDNLAALSPAALFGRRGQSGLQWWYFGGSLDVDGTPTAIANGAVVLANNTTNYVEATVAGAVTANAVGWTPGLIALYTVVTVGGVVTDWTDVRCFYADAQQSRQVAMPDANKTLSAEEARCRVLYISGALTAQRDIVVPSVKATYIVRNATTGGQALRLKTATGAAVVVANGVNALIACDGSDCVKVGSSDATAGAGATTFLSLTDTPANYTGSANFSVRVNAAGTALEFVSPNRAWVGADTGASFTISSATEEIKSITAAATITCANDATIANGTTWTFIQTGAGQVDFAAGAGVTLRYRTGLTPKIIGQNGSAQVIKFTDTEYIVFGELA